MARGGQLLARTLELLKSRVRPGISTKELDTIAEEFIRSQPGASAAFKGLYGFPGSVCISINEEIVHGIPSAKRILKEGDIVSLDFGVKLEGYFTDAAITVPVGEITAQDQTLLAVTQEALAAGIAAARVGNHIGDIGAAISGVVRPAGFTTADDLVGHYVGTKPHGDPQVPNFGKPKRGGAAAGGAHDRDRADGERGSVAHSYALRPVDGGHGRRIALGALRAHHRDPRRGAADPDLAGRVARDGEQHEGPAANARPALRRNGGSTIVRRRSPIPPRWSPRRRWRVRSPAGRAIPRGVVRRSIGRSTRRR